MLLDCPNRGVHLLRDVRRAPATVEVSDDRAGPDAVWTQRGRALAGVLVVDVLADRRIVPVRTGREETGDRREVGVRPDRVRRHTALGRREQRLMALLVELPGAHLLDIAVDCVADIVVEPDGSLPVDAVLEWRLLVRTVDEVDDLCGGIVVLQIDRSKPAGARAGEPLELEEDVLAGVAVARDRSEVNEESSGVVDLEALEVDVFALRDARGRDFLGERRVDLFDIGGVLQEVLERAHLVVERDDGEPLAAAVSLVLVLNGPLSVCEARNER